MFATNINIKAIVNIKELIYCSVSCEYFKPNNKISQSFKCQDLQPIIS